jgi:lipoprotein-anchoring transpeptidase ErfK/SrfK
VLTLTLSVRSAGADPAKARRSTTVTHNGRRGLDIVIPPRTFAAHRLHVWTGCVNTKRTVEYVRKTFAEIERLEKERRERFGR